MKNSLSVLRQDDAYPYIADQIEKTVFDEKQNKAETIESWLDNRMPSGIENNHLKDIDLLCFSKAITPAHLQIVGTCLGFSKVDVEHIEYKHLRAPEAACHDLLVKWRNKHGHSATLAKLMDVFFTAHQNTPESIHDEKNMGGSWKIQIESNVDDRITKEKRFKLTIDLHLLKILHYSNEYIQKTWVPFF
ncbi:unnamed protein product [Mytilus edulis]|uniref:Death domain-containing protein n=1 Tax=Mytilus edulis TaxID=6550 RepID=A0A8S3PZR4_MYTED|nr:unnamed protein product [Mytilus edulis]